MGERVRRHHWSRTPLGPLDTWSAALRSAVSLVLELPSPAVIGWGAELTMIYNDAYLPLLGDKPEALGRPFLEVWSEVREVIEPQIDQVWSGRTVQFSNAEFTLMRHGYRELARFDYSFSPLRDETGTVWGILNTAIETTEHHRAEQALRDSEERYRLLVEGVEEYALLTMDPDGRITLWNTGAERLFGYPAETVLGQRGDLIFCPEDRAAGVPAQEMATALATGRASDERWHLRRDGSRFWASGIMTTLYQPDGRLRGFATVMRDNTQRRQTEKALQRQTLKLEEINRNKTAFLGVLGHELRNPLAAIHNTLEMLSLPGVTEADRREAIDLIRRQGHHLGRLVDDMLDVVRIDRGQITLQPEPLELADSVEDAVNLVREDIDRRHHHLHLDLPRQPLYLEADPERLTQMLTNLLSNAARYTGDGGRIELSARREREEAVIRVRDNGIGIDPEQLPRLFETFTRLAPGQEHYRQGMGLGLALVDKLVGLHGGRLEATSAGEGQGSEFTLRLPALPEDWRPATDGAHAVSENQALPRQCILLIEDEADVAQALLRLLRTLGHKVHLLTVGEGAVAAVKKLHPDLVLSNISLPDISGYEVARRLRRHFAEQCPPLVAVTGRGLEEDRQRARAAGFDRHLTKPINLELLQDLLGKLDSQRD